MYRINQQTTAGFILICSWLFLSCNNSSLDDCETLFIQNLGITNETYALIQNEDRFLTDEEVEQFKAAYFGEGSMEGNKDWSTFEIIIDAYRNCRKTQPLNHFEVESIKSEILSALRRDSVGLIRNYAISDSLRTYQSAIRDTIELYNLKYKKTNEGCYYIDRIERYLQHRDKKVFQRFGRLSKLTELIDVHNDSELLSYYYSSKIDCANYQENVNRSITFLRGKGYSRGWSWDYFKTADSLQLYYGEQNVNNEIIKTLPKPNYNDYQHLRGANKRLDANYDWLFDEQ